jgi:leucyl aminopeptidase (aminopeptidase T)
MNDPRFTTLAKTLIDHSCRLQAGQKVLIEAFDLPEPALVCRLVELASERGALPVVTYKSNAILRSLYKTGTEAGMKLIGQFEAARMAEMDAYIGIRGANNSNEFADVPSRQMDLYQEHWWQPVHIKIRVPKTRWVVLRYPTASMAQAANMSCEAFEDFYFNVCTTAEDASQSLVDAWGSDDEAAARRCATDEVVDELFLTDGSGNTWMSQGCDRTDPGIPVCAYTYEGGAAFLKVEGTEAEGWKVTGLEFVAD